MLPSYLTTNTNRSGVLTVYLISLKRENNGLVTATDDIDPFDAIHRVLQLGNFKITWLFTSQLYHFQLL